MVKWANDLHRLPRPPREVYLTALQTPNQVDISGRRTCSTKGILGHKWNNFLKLKIGDHESTGFEI